MRRFGFRRTIGSVAAAIVIAGGSTVGLWYPKVSVGGGGGGLVANLWIDTNGGTCTRSTSASAYADAAACSSMSAAVSACTAGDTIRMESGTYASQTISRVLSSPGCTIIGGDGGTTTVGGLSTTGAWLTIENVTSSNGITFTDVGGGLPHDILFQNVNVSSGVSFWDGGNNITWNGGDDGPVSVDTDGALVIQGIPPTCPGAGCGTQNLTNVVVENVTFHNFSRSATCITNSCHAEVIRIDDGASNITFRRDTFANGNDPNSGTILIGSKTSTNFAHDVTLENNFFGTSGAQPTALNFGGGGAFALCTNLIVDYNTFSSEGTWFPVNCTNSVSAKWTGNLGAVPGSCGSATYSHNVWTGGTCSASDTSVASLGFGPDGFHITGTSLARGAGDPTSCPSTDRDGETRPQPAATTCDAGADEVG